jgi:minor extracellular serine protease Vpr
MHRSGITLLLLALTNLLPAAAPPGNEWMLLLSEPPVVQQYPGRIEQTRAVSQAYRQHLRDVQSNLRAQIAAQSITVTGAVQHLLNGIFVIATPAQATALRSLPGVAGVVPMRRFHLSDQLTLSDVQQAWNSAPIGGASNAGAGIKVGIIDTGIDQTHPSFQDSSLTPPAGFPKCDTYTLGTATESDCAFTNNKVIVARSYVSTITPGASPSDSRPDDNSARDLTGHGTAVASVVAGVASSYFTNSLSGVAPKAFLGNYKVYGSPEIGGASESGILEALDDAVTDGMDIVNFSSGAPAFENPTDSGAICGNAPGQPCDPLAAAFENAMKNGQVIAVVAAGNDGASGYQYTANGAATYSSVTSPAYTPSVIAAGGIQNDITYADTIDVTGNNVPSDLSTLIAFPAIDSITLNAPLTAPIVDVTQLGDDPLLCQPPATGSLTGQVALIFRGTCFFSVKVPNAYAAGAVAVIIVNNSANPATLTNWGGLNGTPIPALMISQSDGQNLQTFVDANPSTQVTLNTQEAQVPSTTLGIVPESVAYFASRGPSVGNYGLKPDLSAAATNFLLAAENVDPFGDLFSARRYAVADGTSFASPMVAGAAALVKQAQPNLTPLQVKSALVNSATLSGVLDQAGTGPAFIADVGAGLLQAQNAVAAPVTFNPSTISFGSVAGALPAAQTIAVSNPSGLPLTYTVSATTPAPATQVVVTNSGSSITVRLSGSIPPAGRYEGTIDVTGAPIPLHIPYLFVVPSNTAYDIIPLEGDLFDGPVSQELPAAYGVPVLRVIDRFGASVANAPITWAAVTGGGRVLTGTEYTNTTTDINGVAGATVVLGPTPGSQKFSATVNGLTIDFTGNARIPPAISAGGIVDGAAFTANRAVAPGSIISIFGTNLSDSSAGATQFPIPLGISGVAFSFDVPSAGVSLPARFHYVSPTQLNVQVPWELANYPSATVKVIINYTYSATYTLNLATYAPGFFTNPSGSTNAAAEDLTYTVITASHPVARGTTVTLYMNGLGPVNNQPADGWPAGNTSTTTTTPTITIGGQPATVTFSGLAPTFADLYQVNATVPTNISAGPQPVTCTIGGVSCQTVNLYVN